MVRSAQARSVRLTWRASFIFALLWLLIAWLLAGYRPTTVLAVRGLHPLAMLSRDGVLIAGRTTTERESLFTFQIVGPVRFVDVATGSDVRSALRLSEPEDDEFRTIRSAELSHDEKTLVVLEKSSRDRYFLTVFDMAAHAVKLERTIPYRSTRDWPPALAISGDGRWLAWEVIQNDERSIVVWNLAGGKEGFRLLQRCSPAFSPDGEILATRHERLQESLELYETASGELNHSISLTINPSIWTIIRETPQFSPDGKLVAVEVHQILQVRDVASGSTDFQTSGWSPKFLSSGDLMWISRSSQPGKSPHGGGAVRSDYKAPQVVVRDRDGKNERAFVCDLGGSVLSGPVIPRPLPGPGEGQFVLLYETGGGGWTGSPRSSIVASTGLGRRLGLNIPRGIGLDVIDTQSGSKRTYHLDDALTWHPYPQAGKIMLATEDDRLAVWDIPPRRSYWFVIICAVVSAAVTLGCFAFRRRRTPTVNANTIATEALA